MKKLLYTALIAVALTGCKDKTNKDNNMVDSDPITNSEKVAPSAAAKSGEWQVLFDGTNFDAWKRYLEDGVGDAWKIEEGAMVFYPPKERKKGEKYNLVTKDSFTNFVLSLEWKISEGGNSGIFWGVKEIESLHEAYLSGPEIQVLDNKKHPDAKNGPVRQAGALYDMVGPSEDVTKPAGEWNTCVLTVNHKTNEGSVVLNGTEIASFPVNGPDWEAMVDKSKFKGSEHFGKYPTGKIGLQDHGDIVAYRNIKIKSLD
ncbi:3-keto-disaccharide hydrolase [Arenibacter latericius]|uniref:3-keto-disaccharide hydrolase n=1 Tax=Arenibacter latericius TaxID=86104 RepID=UPI0004063836|nr:DUF1080 domain-containing protein [Arenibacter latericius]MDX1363860.1 DUF1080 domain-containing protein [Arenibacter latericius]